MSAQEAIMQFVTMVYASAEVQTELVPIGNDPHAIAAFARARGFAFGGDEFDAFINARLDAGLTPDQKRARAAALAAGGTVDPSPARARECRLVASQETLAAGEDRRRALDGDLVVRRSTAFSAFVAHLNTHIARAFGDDATRAHERLDEAAYYEAARSTDAALAADPDVPRLVADVVRSFGWPVDRVGYFGPFVRYNLPPRPGSTVDGFFSQVAVRVTSRIDAPAGHAVLLNAHRDTWFGAPFHQINLWAPLLPYPPGSGLVLLPRLFSQPLRNNTAGFDVWRAQLGLAVNPICLEPIDRDGELHADLAVGECLLFSANHFHGTPLNAGPSARISVELRLVCDDDRRDGVRSPNVDFHGCGELTSFRTPAA